MATDVQGWIADPASNFGWILIGDEGQDGTAKMFASGEDFLRPIAQNSCSTSLLRHR
jgi:hypothetical protein